MALFIMGWAAHATMLSVQAQRVDFDRDIQPILASRCLKCDGHSKAEAGLRFSGIEAATATLDWIALEPRDNGGSIKAIQREIVTRAVYRQSPEHNPRFAAACPLHKAPLAAIITAERSSLGWPARESSPAPLTGKVMISASRPPKERHTITTFTPRFCTFLGIDHTRLTFRHNGVDRSLTDVQGRVIRAVLS